jgi:hypothetical protein
MDQVFGGREISLAGAHFDPINTAIALQQKRPRYIQSRFTPPAHRVSDGSDFIRGKDEVAR